MKLLFVVPSLCVSMYWYIAVAMDTRSDVIFIRTKGDRNSRKANYKAPNDTEHSVYFFPRYSEASWASANCCYSTGFAFRPVLCVMPRAEMALAIARTLGVQAARKDSDVEIKCLIL